MLNKVILIGNVGSEPEIRSMQNSNEVANFSLATSKRWKDKQTGEKKEKTEWHRVVVFGNGLVDVVKNYVNKGSKLYIEGELQTRKWQDNNGAEKYTTEIIVTGFNCKLTLLDNASKGQEGNNTSGFGSHLGNDFEENNTVDALDDEIPF